ncbi:MAG TPA: TonB family protein [Gemmatirosa sp.]
MQRAIRSDGVRSHATVHPTSTRAAVRARWGASPIRVLVRIALTAVALGNLTVHLGAQPAHAAAAGQGQSHAVLGNVRAADESRLLGAHVSLTVGGPGSPEHADVLTDADGAFTFERVPDGAAVVIVRRLGFRPETLAVDVPQPPGGPIVVMLTRVAQLMPAVLVRDATRRPVGPAYGFEHRRTQGFGHFVTRADIERLRPLRTSDLFRAIPGVTMTTNNSGTLTPHLRTGDRGRGSSCDPAYWLDGMPLGVGAPDLDGLPPKTIESIEVYSGNATIPSALRNTMAAGGCGVIAIWTRHGFLAGDVDDGVGADSLDAMVAHGWAYTADQVEMVAAPLPGFGPAPAYPDSLRAANVAGRVVAEFVVDAQGKVDPETIGVLSSSHRLFAAAVHAALLDARFSPAYREGHVVRQVVQLPVDFDPSPASDAVRKGASQ